MMQNKIKFHIGEFYTRMQNGGICTDEEARIVFEKYPRAMHLLDARYFTEDFIGDISVENIISNVPINCFEKIFYDIKTRKLAYDCVQVNSKLYQSVGINRLDADIMRYMMYLHIEDMMVYQTSLSNEHYRILINSILDYFNAPRKNYNAWAVAIKEGDSPDGMAGIENLHVTTFKSAKGLEFDTVIIPDFDKYPRICGNYNIDWNDFYIGVTRAKMNLYLLSSQSNPSYASTVNISRL
jgi:hypothetical protein